MKRKLWIVISVVILLVAGIVTYRVLPPGRGNAAGNNRGQTRNRGDGNDEAGELAYGSGNSEEAQRTGIGPIGPGTNLRGPTIIDYQPLPLDRPSGDMASGDINKRLAATSFLQREAPEDCPRVDFRFFKPGEDGQMIPARIKAIRFWPFDPKEKARVERIEGAELRGHMYHVPVGLLRLYIVREMTKRQPYRALKMGRTYYVQVYEDYWIDLRMRNEEGTACCVTGVGLDRCGGLGA